MPMMRPKQGVEFGIPDPPRPGKDEPEYQYRYLSYPKTLYRQLDEPDSETGLLYTATIVESEEAKAALGEGWVETPASFVAVTKPQKRTKVVA